MLSTGMARASCSTIIIGIVGAVVGSWIMQHIGGTGITGFNLWSLLVAVLGAVILLVIAHAVRRAA
jgi:uncharacterized membrane protein YeaQ/YmgE (transglycosylase-associated protein family)